MSLSPKSKKLCSQDPQPTMDRISDIPDVILHKILALLPTKQAVGTTILAKRWTHLWTSALTNLDLSDVFLLHQETLNLDRTKTLFPKFVDHVLCHADLPCVTSFTLHCFNSYGSSRVSSWLQKGCNPNVKELDVFVSFDKEPIRLPSTVVTSTSLVVLKLSANVKFDIPSNGVCFPSLKMLNVFVYNQKDDVLTRRLYSSCPVLEDLVLGGEMLDKRKEVVFRIVSSSLKRLRINFHLAHRFGSNHYCFKVRAENLESIDVNDDFLAEYIVDSLLVLDNANVCVGHPTMDYSKTSNHSNRAFRLLGGLLQVKSLSLSGCTTGALSVAQNATYPEDDDYDYDDDDSDDDYDDDDSDDDYDDDDSDDDYDDGDSDDDADCDDNDGDDDDDDDDAAADNNVHDDATNDNVEDDATNDNVEDDATNDNVEDADDYGDGNGDGDGDDVVAADVNIVDDADDDGNMEDDDFIVPDAQNQMHSLPTFSCLTHLEFGFLKCSSWTLLLHVLEQSPNLEFLVLKKEQNLGNFTFPSDFSWTSQESVPKCLLYHLKEIKIEGFKGQEPEMMLVKFFLENARVLQKMTIDSQPLSSYEVMVLHGKVLAFPRGSKACQVELF